MTSFLQKLGFGLKKSSAKLTGGISSIFTKRRVDAQTLDELEELLISSDIGVRASAKIIGSFAKRRLNKDVGDTEIKNELAADIEAILQPCEQPLAIDDTQKPFVILMVGVNGAGKTTTLRLLAHIEDPDTGVVEYGHGCKIGYFAQEHDTLDLNATVLENLTHVAPELNDTQARSILGSFLFSGDDAFKPARVLSGGEKTRLALATLVTSRANVLLLDEPTNNLDPASRDEILKAIAKYEGAIVLVTHDEGAVQALNPERVLLMPDGDEDLWNDSYLDLVAEE